MKKLPELPEKEKTIFKLELEPELPKFQDVSRENIDVRYALIAPYAYAHIHWDDKLKELIYEVEEPQLGAEEKRILGILEDGIKELINISYLELKQGETTIEYLEKNLKVILNELRITLTKDSYLKIMYFIYRDFVGLNQIEPLMNDYFIEDIECNGTNYPLYVVHRKYRNLKTTITFEKTKELATFVEKLAQKSGQYISYATPLLDGALPDGSRVNATFTEDIASRGPTFTIRKFTKKPWSPTQLMYLKTISPEMLAYLWLLIEYEKNIMVIGGTASGKTSLLNGLSFFIPPQARIVSIEDTRELNIEHSNWLPAVARSGVGLANLVGQKYGEITLFNLLKESFRMNPDYVIIGEIRGDEAYVLFQGMASGHPSFGTMHANDIDTMIKRLETPPINLSASLVETLDVVVVMIQTKVAGKPVRRVRDITEIISVQGSRATTNRVFSWDPNTDSFAFSGQSHLFQELVSREGINEAGLMNEFRRRSEILAQLYTKNIFGFAEVQSIIHGYYKDPNKILSDLGIS